jgi:hypothetical protein
MMTCLVVAEMCVFFLCGGVGDAFADILGLDPLIHMTPLPPWPPMCTLQSSFGFMLIALAVVAWQPPVPPHLAAQKLVLVLSPQVLLGAS